MESLDDFITLHSYKGNDDDLFKIFDAGTLGQVKLYVQSTESSSFIFLANYQIQQIKSYHPEKVSIDWMFPEKSSNKPTEEAEYKKHVQIVNFSDIWVNKNAIDELNRRYLQPETIPFASINTEKTSMLKLILGMAVNAYGFDPAITKNRATGRNKGSIKYDLNKVGLRIDEDTVRKYLKEAMAQYQYVRARKREKS